MTPTQASFSDDFSSDNWTYSRAGTDIQITGGKHGSSADYSQMVDNSVQQLYKGTGL